MAENIIPDQLRGMAEFARASTLSAAKSGLGPERAVRLARKLALALDGQIDRGVSKGPPSDVEECCHRVVFVTIAEVAAIVEHVRSRSDELDLVRLRGELQSYERVVGSSFGVNSSLNRLRPKCPLLRNRSCSIYDARPLRCRCKWIADPDESPLEEPDFIQSLHIADAITIGHQMAAGECGFNGGHYDLGRALKIALENPQALANHLSGLHDFLPALIIDGEQRGTSANEPLNFAKYCSDDEPSGFMNPGSAAADAIRQGDFSSAVSAIPPSHPLHALWKIHVPWAYFSMDEIPEARARFASAVEDYAEAKYDPKEAYDAMGHFSPLCLSYQQLNDCDLLARLGQVLCENVSAKALPDLCHPLEKKREGKLKVGYIGRSLDRTSSGSWAIGWLSNHSKDIERYVFYLGDNEDFVTRQFRSAADHYFRLRGPLPPFARFIKSLDLDVLIYTDIGIDGLNTQFATLRLAPVQCTCWGGPETSGLPTIDYYLSSELMEPADGNEHYSERLVRLPGTGVCLPPIDYPASHLTKADFGLDEGPLYLCCQSAPKLLPKWDHLYLQIGERTGRPIVFIHVPGGGSQVVRKRLQGAGINAVFLPTVGMADYLGLLSCADVILDTPGWSGGITTIQSLWMKKPVVTLPGDFRRGRQSMAFLHAAYAPGLVAKDASDYVDLVVNDQRRYAAAIGLDGEALFNDARCVDALDSFLLNLPD